MMGIGVVEDVEGVMCAYVFKCQHNVHARAHQRDRMMCGEPACMQMCVHKGVYVHMHRCPATDA